MDRKTERKWFVVAFLALLLSFLVALVLINAEGVKCVANPFKYTQETNHVNLQCTATPASSNATFGFCRVPLNYNNNNNSLNSSEIPK